MNLMKIKINEKVIEVEEANSFFKRFRGFMLKKRVDKPLLFKFNPKKPRIFSSVHSLFCFFDICIIFVDENLEVYDIKVLKPWRFYLPKKSPKYLIEIAYK